MGSPFKGYLDDYLVPEDLTQDIKTEINEGCLIVHYSGHGSIQIWAGASIFDNADVADLTNDGKFPFFISMNCLSGYFAYPEGWLEVPSLAEVLLRSEAKGAVAALMPTGMTTTTGQQILSEALFEAIFTEDTGSSVRPSPGPRRPFLPMDRTCPRRVRPSSSSAILRPSSRSPFPGAPRGFRLRVPQGDHGPLEPIA